MQFKNLMRVIGIIPARYASSRFRGKPLVDILGKSMIQRVYEQSKKCSLLIEVIVATDSKRIFNHVLEFGGLAIMTDAEHQSGTDRCNEVVQKIDFQYDIVVNIQGDEPYINPKQIEEVVNLFEDKDTQIGTLAKKITTFDVIKDENSPKAIFDANGNALNFCRKIINPSNKCSYYKHVGIYAFKKKILTEICNLPQSKNEILKQLEQLRWLDNGYKIKVGITNFKSLSVDTPQDVEKISQLMR